MNFGRCLEILELESAQSLAQVKKAYRQLVNVWHPDRFSHDPLLKQKAERKIQQVNSAYEQLETFFTRRQYKTDPVPIAGERAERSAAPGKEGSTRTGTQGKKSSGSSRQGAAPAAQRPVTAAGSGSVGKYVFWGFLFAFAIFTALVLHLLPRMDDSITRVTNDALVIIQEKMKGGGKTPTENGTVPAGGYSADHRPATVDAAAGDVAGSRQQCIIILNSGGYIIAQSWWYDEDMVAYRVKQGVVGIEKNRVKEIRCE